jgi:type IV secretory pathway VirB9-like protein
MNVVRVVASTFTSTQIVFATTETITHIAIGDREAWAPEPTGNLLFLKPVEVRQPTNMQVVTQRSDGSARSYQFLLIARGVPSSSADRVADLGGTIPEVGEVTPFAIHFVYPEDARRRRLPSGAQRRPGRPSVWPKVAWPWTTFTVRGTGAMSPGGRRQSSRSR